VSTNLSIPALKTNPVNRQFALLLSLFTLLAAVTCNSMADDSKDDPLWKDVNTAMNEGRPQTAIEKLGPIIARATEARDFPEAIKAISLRLDLEASIRGDQPDLKIRQMRNEIETAPAEMRPVMEAIQAAWMWEFFQQHRWRFAQRTTVIDQPAEDAGDADENAADQNIDLLTMDLTGILRTVDAQFARSLRNAEPLKTIPAQAYAKLLEAGNVPEKYRPTMYDILVHHALEFYSAGEQAGSRSIDAFVVSADSPIFASLNDFLAWDVQANDARAAHRVAVQLYQDLLRFHLNDAEPSARLDVDLARLEFGYDHAVGEEKKARFAAALKRFEQEQASHPISTRALYELALLAHQDNQWVDAHRIASQGLARFPDSIGAARCFNLIKQIEARQSTITTERVWNDPWSQIDVQYRNVNKVFFRLVKFDFEEFVGSGRWQPESMDDDRLKRLLALPVAKAWSSDLPATPDYQMRTELVSVPQDIASGSYFLLSSHRSDFQEADNQMGLAEVWVSKLAIITRNRQGSGMIGGLVVDAKSGEPIAGATIKAWDRTPNNRLTVLASVRTDKDGRFDFPVQNRNRLLLLATHRDQQLSSANFISTYRGNEREPIQQQTHFFTDRAIYRPGQTIRYKGICYSADHHTDQYQTLQRRDVSVMFMDSNGKEIERLTHRTNDYGSFNGSFVAPRDRLTGQMIIRIVDGPAGQAVVRVEEYKRPKFQVELASPEPAAKLGAEVNVTGLATAFTGAPIDGGSVSWRVVREVRFPPWWFWRSWFPPNSQESEEIARGITTTAASGKFDLQFIAKPDLSVSTESEPTFIYKIYADVTDSSGETRSSTRTINLGYTALVANLSTDPWLTSDKAFELKVRTTTLDGDSQSAEGTVQIHSLIEPETVVRPPLAEHHVYRNPFDNSQPRPDANTTHEWKLGEVVFESAVKTDGDGNQSIAVTLPAGAFRAVLKSRDRFGKEVTALLPLEIINPAARKFPIKIANQVRLQKESLQPGDTMRAVWGSGYSSARALVEIEHRGQIVKRFWTSQDRTQLLIEHPVTEAMRGGFTLHVTMVRENRAYLVSQPVEVPWSNKELSIKWERFVSKLQPGQQETWTAVISGKDAERAAAEMVATLYDASLDVFLPHTWMSGFGVFRQDQSTLTKGFENRSAALAIFRHNWLLDQRHVRWDYPRLPSRSMPFQRRGRAMNRSLSGAPEAMMDMAFGAAPAPMAAAFAAEGMGGMGGGDVAEMAKASGPLGGDDGDNNGQVPQVDLDGVSARKNLQETAFFFPHVVAAADGTIRLQFTMPEALTRWQFYGFAHDQQLRAGLLSDSVVTSKDLMVQPNPPRFLREGDVVEFAVKVTNQSPTRQTGAAVLSFSEARTGDSVDDRLENSTDPKPFELASGQSQSLSWRIRVPDGIDLLTYRAVGSSGRLSDGEEGYLPVLPRRILVTESLPLPIRGKQTRTFDFARLAASADSDSIKHQSLTVQMASNPSWYAVMSLPYLMEFPHQCSEQIFNRLYANSLAHHIATSDPKIEAVFQQWRATEALDSPLSKNEDLKAVLIEETPWFRQAESESQARRNVGILFDQNRLADETQRALNQLSQQQLDDGRWPWFPGGSANDFITLYITTGFGRLRHLGAQVDVSPGLRALQQLDAWMAQMHEQAMKRKGADENTQHLSHTIAFYLYGRSFFLQDQAVAPQHSVALAFWLDQAKRHWLKLGSLQSQAHLAIALSRFDDPDTANRIMVSIKERAVNDEEMGMHWPAQQRSPWWFEAPIETQAAIIEAFDEVANDAAAVEDCKVWLLKQKQTQDWETTKATADAIYALLLRGTDILASDRLVEVTVGGTPIRPADVEAGTGFFEQRTIGPEVTAELSKITVTKQDEGVAWGSVHWQYFEDIDRITAADDNPLKLTKELYIKRNTDAGPVLERVTGNVKVGDELVVRLVLRTDRDLEFVHIRDHRGSGTEPVNVLSSYRWRDGLGYYESTRDTASHFFIDFMRQGTYVFEYSTRVQLRGEYQTGMAMIQCMYAPEFGSHSESIPLIVD